MSDLKVELLELKEDSDSSQGPAQVPPGPTRRFGRAWLVAGLVGALALVGGGFLVWRWVTEVRHPARYLPLTFTPGTETRVVLA
jgi:hypothetical protein